MRTKLGVLVIAIGVLVAGVAAPVHAEGTVTATVDCSTFVVTVDGYPDGSQVYIWTGSSPPWGFITDGPHVSAAPIGLYESTHVFDAGVEVWPTGAPASIRVFDQVVDCTPAVIPVTTEAAPVVPDSQPVVEPDTPIWFGLELAPPW